MVAKIYTKEDLFKAFVAGDTEGMRKGDETDIEEFEDWFNTKFKQKESTINSSISERVRNWRVVDINDVYTWWESKSDDEKLDIFEDNLVYLKAENINDLNDYDKTTLYVIFNK